MHKYSIDKNPGIVKYFHVGFDQAIKGNKKGMTVQRCNGTMV
jgi:hypothetical protein